MAGVARSDDADQALGRDTADRHSSHDLAGGSRHRLPQVGWVDPPCVA